MGEKIRQVFPPMFLPKNEFRFGWFRGKFFWDIRFANVCANVSNHGLRLS
jgi:hypothetical protein